MWLLRGVGKNRWQGRGADDPAHVAAAAKDLSLRPGEDGLSLIRVDDEDDGRRVATRLGVYKALERGQSDHVDYILIPPDVFATLGLSVVPVPDPALGPELSDRHREAKGITDAISAKLATALLGDQRFQLGRIPRQEVDRAMRDATAPGE
jgi:hypothetical protein